jgi:preprotein translocase subunit SecD
LVMLFMIMYYRLPGGVSALALAFYAVLNMAIFKLLPVTLSLAGIAGFIVSIGMAVDANVLIFERLKEEMKAGRTLGAGIEAGFNRAWSAIWDANFTTFIACIALYLVGNAVASGAAVKGFALTLFIGILVSMFTAVTVTRTLLRLVVGTDLAKNKNLFLRTEKVSHV